MPTEAVEIETEGAVRRAETLPNPDLKGLRLKDGNWTLEIETMINVGRGILRPSVQPVIGADTIIYYLDQISTPELAAHARQLLTDPELPKGKDRWYEVRGVDWCFVPNGVQLREDAIEDARRQAAELHRAALKAAQEMAAQLRQSELDDMGIIQLESKVSRMMAALQSLESRISSLEDTNDSAPPISSATARPTPAAAPAVPAPVSLDQPADAAEPEEAKSGAAQTPEDRIETLPPISDIDEHVRTLAGCELALIDVDPVDLSPQERFFVAPWDDPEGQCIGALVMNLEAVSQLGCSMLMAEESEISEMIASGAPSEDALDASSEIGNNVASLVNRDAGRSLVQSKPFVAFDENTTQWFSTARLRLDLRDDASGMILVLLAR